MGSSPTEGTTSEVPLIFPEHTLNAVAVQAVSDAFGAPFEFNPEAPALSLRSVEEHRYLDAVTDCGAKPHRGRLPGLYTDDTQQAMVLLWLWAKMKDLGLDPEGKTGVLTGIGPLHMDENFIKVCQKMALGRKPFGVHRGTGRNFREAVTGPTPAHTAGMGAAMRIGPVATLIEREEDVVPWCVEVSKATTTHPMGLAAAGYFGLACWRASRGLDISTPFPFDSPWSKRLDSDVLEALWFMSETFDTLIEVKEGSDLDAFMKHVNEDGGTDPKQEGPADGFGPSGVIWAMRCVTISDTLTEALSWACCQGGDTDTVCALVGALWGAARGKAGVEPWLFEQAAWTTLDPNEWHPVRTEAELCTLEREHVKATR